MRTLIEAGYAPRDPTDSYRQALIYNRMMPDKYTGGGPGSMRMHTFVQQYADIIKHDVGKLG